MDKTILAGFCALLLNAGAVHAQTTAFTYQGILSANGVPANSTNDFTFRLFGIAGGGVTLAGPITNLNVHVTNGLFTVLVDFGAIGDAFYASDRWLEIATRPAGGGAFVNLTPRQPITATPRALYAGYAGSAAAASTLNGPLPGASLAGHYPQTVSITNAANQFRGSFTGNGGGLTNLNASQLTSGTVPDARLAGNVARRDQTNTFTGAQTITNGGQIPLRVQGNDNGGTWVDLANASAGGRTWNLISSGSGNPEGPGKLLLRDSAQGVLMTLSTNGNVGIGTVNPQDRLDVNGSVNANGLIKAAGGLRVNQTNVWFRGDNNHGLGWYGDVRPFAGVSNLIDGPVLFGYGGGALATEQFGTEKIALHWKASGNVGIGTNNPQSALHVVGTVKANAFAGNWEEVTGTAQQAVPNRGYLANNVAQVSITLPPTPAVGDVVRVAGMGTGGWKIVQNSGQVIRHWGIRDPGTVWIPRESARNWQAVASSADGTKLAAVVSGGQIYTSTDSGVNWNPRESNRNWIDVASSADGVKLVACVSGGRIYTSTDSGVNWTPRGSNVAWRTVASSADGTKLVACVNLGQIFTSTDSGVNWTPRDSNRDWKAVASSADGTKLIAVVGSSAGRTYTSTDSGVSWTPGTQLGDMLGVASSADGSKLVVVGLAMQSYTSADSGANWTPRGNNGSRGASSSADGSKLVACYLGGLIHSSRDFGVNWTPRESTRDWIDVASSADGSKLVAVDYGGQIYTSDANSSVGVNGGLTAGQDAAVELIHIGGGAWRVLSHEGTITPF